MTQIKKKRWRERGQLWCSAVVAHVSCMHIDAFQIRKSWFRNVLVETFFWMITEFGWVMYFCKTKFGSNEIKNSLRSNRAVLKILTKCSKIILSARILRLRKFNSEVLINVIYKIYKISECERNLISNHFGFPTILVLKRGCGVKF